MNISISQNFKNVLKNKIKILISPILYKSIDFIVDNLFEINNPDKYFYFMNTIQSSVKELIKNIVITAFEELDNNFKNSNNRTSRYIINKSNVSRTIITIVGEITFSRTYYINKFSGDKFFYVDNCFDLPKYDHYDPIIKAIAINNAVNTIIENNPNRKDTITKKLNYILNNYSSIKAMLELKIGSSMESHISHLIASFFSSRPKGFSTKRIKQYLKLNDYKNNNINIFKLYIQSYKNTEIKKINEEIINNYTFDNNSNGNIPVLNDGLITPMYEILNELAH